MAKIDEEFNEDASLNSSLNMNTNSNGYLDIIKNYNHKAINLNKYRNIYNDKYTEYKRKWNEILKREKRIFLAKWTSNVRSQNYRLDDFEVKL